MRGDDDDTTWITEIRKFFLEQPSISILITRARALDEDGIVRFKRNVTTTRQVETRYGIFVYLYTYIYIILYWYNTCIH